MSGRLPGELSTHTHFFRGEAELEEALGVLAGRAAAGRVPTIWCAGCSTGAEPYTIAMLCAERGFRALIHATDLNAEALASARAACYPEIALRFVPPPLRERYFERDGSDHQVARRIVERVTFEHSDLRSDPLPFPPLADGAGGWDVILCRNVLIYYEPDAAAAIVERLATALRRDGVLIMGSTDPLAFRALGSLRAVNVGGVASYAHARPDAARGEGPSRASPSGGAVQVERPSHRDDPEDTLRASPSGVAAVADRPVAREPLADVASREPPVEPGAAARVAAPFAAFPGASSPGEGPRSGPAASIFTLHAALDLEPPSVPPEELPSVLSEACAELADHRWEDAEVAFRRAERASPLAPEPPLYLGVLRRKQGRFDEAAEHLRRAVFLTPRCWIASYLLAGVWDRLGDRARARLELRRTLDTVRSLGDAAAREAWPLGAEIAGLDFDPAEVARACEARLSH